MMLPEEQAQTPDEARDTPSLNAPTRQHYRAASILAVGTVLVVASGLLLGGEIGQFVLAGAQHLPFLLLAFLAMLGWHHEWARWASYGWALLLQGMVGLATLNFMVLGLTEDTTTMADGTVMPALAPADLMSLAVGMLLLLLLFAGCSAVLFPAVRQRLTRWLPIDPDNYTHTLALWVVLYTTASATMQLLLLGGMPPLLTAINSGVISADDLGQRSDVGQSLDLIYGLVWMVPLAFVAAGWPLRRSFGTTLHRLGLVVPSWRQVALALGGALVLAVAINLLGEGITYTWEGLGWPVTDEAAFEQLLGALLSPVGALVIGITAGLGEEIAVRGLLQPRLGLLLSNLAFTSVHAFQYSFDALIIVFVLGMLLGVVRNRTNTTTAALLHGAYNALIVLAGVLWG